MPERIQLRRTKGWRKPEMARVVARPTMWGNLWKVTADCDAEHAVLLYREELASGDKARLTGYACACPEPTAPTRPAVVLDPFCGTGTTVMVAKALGRHGIGIDLSRDYLRLAEWRINESGHGRKTVVRTWNERHVQMDLGA